MASMGMRSGKQTITATLGVSPEQFVILGSTEAQSSTGRTHVCEFFREPQKSESALDNPPRVICLRLCHSY